MLADGTGTISGIWFLSDGAQDITVDVGVQIVDAIPDPSAVGLGKDRALTPL